MSLQNLLKENNYNLYCNEVNANIQNIATVVVDNITINNAVVTGSVTTPNITSGTSLFNTVDTLNINAVNGTIDNLTVTNTLTVPSLITPNINCDNINVSNTTTSLNANITNLTATNASLNSANISTTLTTPNINVSNTTTSLNANITNLTATNASLNSANISTTLTAPTINTNSITSINGNISSLTSSSISSGTGNITSLTGNDLNYNTGNINSLSGSDINYSTGNISTLSGSEFNYDVGYAAALSCKELRIFTELVECPRATIDDLYIRNTLNVDNIQTNTTGTVNFNNQITGTEIVLNTRMNAPTTETDSIRTISGSGNVTFNSPYIFTAVPGYIQEAININAKQSQTTPVSGGVTTAPTNVTLQYCRSGSQVLINVPDRTFTSSGVAGILILTPPAPWSFPAAFAAGTCILNYAGINYQINYRYVSLSNQFQFTANNESNLLNSGVGCPVVPAAATFQIRGFTISLVV